MSRAEKRGVPVAPHGDTDDALHRLWDARDGISPESLDPETLWLQIKYHLAPVSDVLASDFHRYASGAWTLGVYLTRTPGLGSLWRPPDDARHRYWASHPKSRVAEFYLPHEGRLMVAVPGRPPMSFDLNHPDASGLRLIIDRAQQILLDGHACETR